MPSVRRGCRVDGGVDLTAGWECSRSFSFFPSRVRVEKKKEAYVHRAMFFSVGVDRAVGRAPQYSKQFRIRHGTTQNGVASTRAGLPTPAHQVRRPPQGARLEDTRNSKRRVSCKTRDASERSQAPRPPDRWIGLAGDSCSFSRWRGHQSEPATMADAVPGMQARIKHHATSIGLFLVVWYVGSVHLLQQPPPQRPWRLFPPTHTS